MFVVDTNVPVFAADERSLAHPVCVQRLEEWRGGSGAWLRERFNRDPLGGIDREDQDDSAKSQVPTPKNTQNTALTLPISPLCGSLRRRPT